ncbi:MAG TPA: peptide deformylase [Methylomirabilota bacterium]|jgi:peptide deformylase|nr:peptide deformylase [Methylomirabilota bacterium]
MAILKVARLGHPVLRRVAELVAPESIMRPEFQQFIDDMIETMYEYEGVGLAAPQVHVSQQVAVLEVSKHPRYPDAPSVPLTVLINPRVTILSEETVEGWEGCLSIPDLRGVAPRHRELRVEALDRRGNPLDFVAKEFHARVIQHEYDHLQGKVYLDRMPSLETLTHLTEWQRYWLKA